MSVSHCTLFYGMTEATRYKTKNKFRWSCLLEVLNFFVCFSMSTALFGSALRCLELSALSLKMPPGAPCRKLGKIKKGDQKIKIPTTTRKGGKKVEQSLAYLSYLKY